LRQTQIPSLGTQPSFESEERRGKGGINFFPIPSKWKCVFSSPRSQLQSGNLPLKNSPPKKGMKDFDIRLRCPYCIKMKSISLLIRNQACLSTQTCVIPVFGREIYVERFIHI